MPTPNKPIDLVKLKQFVQSQKRVRIAFDNGPNSGNQAANINILHRLKLLGFQGTIELIYPAAAKTKIFELLGIDEDSAPSFSYDGLSIKGIEEADFISSHDDRETLSVGLTGGIDTPMPFYMGSNQKAKDFFTSSCNWATFYKVKTFIWISPFHNKDDTYITQHDGECHPLAGQQRHSRDKFLVAETPNLNDVKNYLSTSTGRNFLIKNPGLMNLIDAIGMQQINFQPVYGWPLVGKQPLMGGNILQDNEDRPNLLNIILGAQYAQTHGDKKPIIIILFYEYTDEVVARLRRHRDLDIPTRLHIASLKDKNIAEMIRQLHGQTIMLLFTGPLPKIIFEGIYTHTANNFLPPVREGASALTALLQTGRPHIRCKYEGVWDFNIQYPFLTSKTKDQLERLVKFTCMKNFNNWHSGIPKIIGEYILEAQDPHSELSLYFRMLAEEVRKPENDRINYALAEVAKMQPKVEDTQVIPRTLSWRDKYFLMGYNKLIDYVVDSVVDIVKSSPSYFPKDNPHYWGSSTQSLLFKNSTNNSTNLTAMLNTSYTSPRLL